MNTHEELMIPAIEHYQFCSSPVIMGPKLPSNDQLFFSSKQKQISLENVVLSFSELNPNLNISNNASPSSLNMKLPSNAISINMDSQMNSSYKDSMRELSSPKNQEVKPTTTIFRTDRNNNNKDSMDKSSLSVPGAQTLKSLTNTKPQEKKIDLEKSLTKILKKTNFKECINKFLNSIPVTIIVNFLTIFVLFADDIRTSAFTIDADNVFDTMILSCLGIFSFEILLTIFSRKGYFLSFFFYLDTISTITLLFDVELFQEATLLKNNASMNATQMARMGRASRIGTRAARIIRLVRLFRIVKLYKTALDKQNQGDLSKPSNSPKSRSPDLINNPSIQLNQADGTKKKLSGFGSNLLSNNRGSIRKTSQLQPRLSKFSGGGGGGRNSSLFLNNKQVRLSNASERPRLMSRMSHKWYMNSNNNSAMTSPHKSIKSPTSFNADSMNQENNNTEMDTLLDVQDQMKLKESAVGKKLSEQSTKRVIVLVLIILIFVPLFESRFYFDTSYSFLSGVIFLSNIQNTTTGDLLIDESELQSFCLNYTSFESSNRFSTLVYLSTPFTNSSCSLFQNGDPSTIRFDERLDIQVPMFNNGSIVVSLDQSYSGTLNAIINMVRTVFVTVALLSGTLFFSKDANDLVLTPIERMIEKVNKIANNPLAIKEFRLASESGGITNELVLIENSIVKIGTLLALGFGEAGREIIASNMNKGGGLDHMSRGNRKYAVYGFCDIRNFTDATEVLQEDVMVFVNNIAEIVHGIVDRCLGSANKNIGDAFLLVWKLPDMAEDILKDQIEMRRVTDICDLAVFSFLKIIGKLNRHPRILQYRTHPKLISRFKDYKVRLGFGMHYGWAIEGAIGSGYKIDASYLSPNVNLASRLEAATKQYGVPFLLSSELFRCLSYDIQQFARRIDYITLKGSTTPLGLYTFDVRIDDMPPSKPEAARQAVLNKRKIQKEAIQTLYQVKNYAIKDLFLYDKEIKLLMRDFEKDLVSQRVFQEGLQAYLDGDWANAKEKLEAFIKIKGKEDSPSNVILDFMKKNYWKCPEDWPGYRELIEK